MAARAALLLAGFLLPAFACAESPTERYAPVKLRVARNFLEQAHARAALGEKQLASTLAWQASFDARLAWGMSDSEQLRAEAAELGGEASALYLRLSPRR